MRIGDATSRRRAAEAMARVVTAQERERTARMRLRQQRPPAAAQTEDAVELARQLAPETAAGRQMVEWVEMGKGLQEFNEECERRAPEERRRIQENLCVGCGRPWKKIWEERMAERAASEAGTSGEPCDPTPPADPIAGAATPEARDDTTGASRGEGVGEGPGPPKRERIWGIPLE
jgi:hypothetical protein